MTKKIYSTHISNFERKLLAIIKEKRTKKPEIYKRLSGYFAYSKVCNYKFMIDETLKELEKKSLVIQTKNKNNQVYYKITKLAQDELKQC